MPQQNPRAAAMPHPPAPGAALFGLLLVGLACLWAAPSHADERRIQPDYDGRGEPPTTLGDVLIWVPRVLFSPVYFVTEFVVRRPLGFVIAGAERAGLPAFLFDFFTFGDEHQAGIIPTAYVDFDFYPSVGLYAFWDDALADGHDMRLRAAIGGGEWLAASMSQRVRITPDPYDRIALEASGERRPDFTFFGLGPDSRQENLVRYGKDTLELRGLLDKRLSGPTSLHAEAAYRKVAFRRGGFDEDAVLDDAIGALLFPPPPGYESGYELVRGSVGLAYDSRQPRPAPGSGIRLQAHVSPAVSSRGAGSFVRYGATLGGFWDIDDRARVLSMTVTTRFADPLDDGEIPFTELVTLGGQEAMRGLFPGRLLDQSAFVAGLGYRWPIWIWLDGGLRGEVGNVFGEHLAGLALPRMRWSAQLGVESNGSPDTAFMLSLGVGSETFESGGEVSSFRIAAGTTHGF